MDKNVDRSQEKSAHKGFAPPKAKMVIHIDSLYDKWNKNRNDKITEKYYKKFRNRAVHEIRESKSEYFNNYFDQHRTSLKINLIKYKKNCQHRTILIQVYFPNFSRW